VTAAGRGRAVPAVAAVTAGPADADALSHLIADAFHDLPPSRWLIAEWLAIIGVRPGRQGRGIGSALLSARHRDLDRDGRPAYLEAASPLARDLYLRHGYDLRPGAPFHLPDGGPPMWPMLREAGAPG
jgi:GNAT superfamily N-acetyltransferase